MGERKVLNKYYPPDFDPAKIPKVKRPKNDQVKVRMMLPMSIRCNTCGEYLYKGKKFNSRKETVTGEEYLGIKIFRFYIKCTRCSAELTIKTDPKNSDYQCEWGASRNFEPWRENKKAEEQAKEKREKEELGDAMKALENRTKDSKIEMDILDALDEIRSLNARQSKMDPIEILLQKQKDEEAEQQRLTEEDEDLVKSVYGDGPYVKRIYEEEEEDETEGLDDGPLNGSLLKNPKISPDMDVFTSVKKQKTESPEGTTNGILKVTPKVVPAIVPKVTPKVVVAKVVPKVVVAKVVPKIAAKAPSTSSSSSSSSPSSSSPLSSSSFAPSSSSSSPTPASSSKPATNNDKAEPAKALSSLLGAYDDDSE